VKLEKRQWCENIERRMRESLGEGSAEIREQCQTGKADVWEVAGHGLLVLRMEGDELVFVATQGENMTPVFVAILEKLKPKTARAHSAIPGVGRLLKRVGFDYLETVYRWKNGQ